MRCTNNKCRKFLYCTLHDFDNENCENFYSESIPERLVNANKFLKMLCQICLHNESDKCKSCRAKFTLEKQRTLVDRDNMIENLQNASFEKDGELLVKLKDAIKIINYGGVNYRR